MVENPTPRRLRGQIAAASTHSRHSAFLTTRAARLAFANKFLDEVDPDRVLPEPEREFRAAQAKKLYFLRLAALSAKARGARKTAKAKKLAERREAAEREEAAR